MCCKLGLNMIVVVCGDIVAECSALPLTPPPTPACFPVWELNRTMNITSDDNDEDAALYAATGKERADLPCCRFTEDINVQIALCKSNFHAGCLISMYPASFLHHCHHHLWQFPIEIGLDHRWLSISSGNNVLANVRFIDFTVNTIFHYDIDLDEGFDCGYMRGLDANASSDSESEQEHDQKFVVQEIVRNSITSSTSLEVS
ncbi:uncharacterized protein EDB91DRAFT_1086103 [Suillus paluster]|uniref:uncharacterized protein n=1 Tax=Suillus paluster TaxID=48578 RepID=UPI001B86BC5E|nr:uncharacterized protein EDB91DRAFT_1086103 [Suillus paluster]KAG1728367.1 hypothetical protein EDB91DRAFT_1086103 [Suillus paluster]